METCYNSSILHHHTGKTQEAVSSSAIFEAQRET